MAEVVLGVLASHTTLMNTKWAEVDHLDRAHAFRDALGTARAAIENSGADVAVIVGPNHFRGLWLDLMPTFTIGVGEVAGVGEHGTPAGPLPIDPDLARGLLCAAIEAGFDPALSARLQVDHGITHAVQWIVPDGMPIVPVVVNCLAPPMARLDRCVAFGSLIGSALAEFGDRRVVVVGSGGLSHQLPFPDWRAPRSDDDDYLVESWIDGRDKWEQYEPRRRAIVVNAEPRVEQLFDEAILATFERGGGASLIDHQTDLAELGGNGANELRNWIIAAAACGFAASRTLCYSPMPEWLTGMGVALIDQPRVPSTSPNQQERHR